MQNKMGDKDAAVTIRDARPTDRLQLRQGIVELQDYERRLHETRLPGEQVADDYQTLIEKRSGEGGAVLIAEIDGRFVGFVAGWIEHGDALGETPEANRFGYISDLCVMPQFRGQRIATRLLAAIEERLSRAGISRTRISSLATNTSARACYERSGFEAYEITYEKPAGNRI